MFIEVLIKSLIIGAIGGGAIAAGAARMFHAPEVQGMGSFRTLGEINACKGDPISHYSFGLGFLFNAAAAAVSTGALTQDVMHRVVPNWAAGTLLLRERSVDATLLNPTKMALAGALAGAAAVALLNTVSALVPENAAKVAGSVLGNASSMMINPVMPIIFLLAALDAGRYTGIAGLILGGLSHMIMGNAVPGAILGILIGKSIEEQGYSRPTWVMIFIVALLFILIAYFRGFHETILALF